MRHYVSIEWNISYYTVTCVHPLLNHVFECDCSTIEEAVIVAKEQLKSCDNKAPITPIKEYKVWYENT
jgi:hypothetical protein